MGDMADWINDNGELSDIEGDPMVDPMEEAHWTGTCHLMGDVCHLCEQEGYSSEAERLEQEKKKRRKKK